jgi:hypothetical protein
MAGAERAGDALDEDLGFGRDENGHGGSEGESEIESEGNWEGESSRQSERDAVGGFAL